MMMKIHLIAAARKKQHALGIPCLTMRPNTERPVTVAQGTNQLCTLYDVKEKAIDLLSKDKSGYEVPSLWDGKTASRVMDSISRLVCSNSTVNHRR